MEERCWICGRTRKEVVQALIDANRHTDSNTLDKAFFIPNSGLPPFCWVCLRHILSIIEMTQRWEKDDMKKSGVLGLFSIDLKKHEGE